MGINGTGNNDALENQLPNNQLPNNPEELKQTMQAIDTLIGLATDKPWIKIEKKGTWLEISTSGLFHFDNIVNASNETKPYIRKITNEINNMMRNGYIDSVDIIAFVWKEYIQHRMEGHPESDIGEGIEGACEARGFWGKQWITNPTDETKEWEPLWNFKDKINVLKWGFVSDKKDLTYTIKFKDQNN